MKKLDFQELVDQNLSGLVWDASPTLRTLRALAASFPVSEPQKEEA